MPAGTIALTNGSSTVTGSGTSFTSELQAGDFIYVMVGGASYTLVASAVGSNIQVTLAIAYDGPTSSGLAWVAAPALMQAAITQKILNDFATVARGRILDFQNWQKIYSEAQTVTVTRPDRTTFTGPSWGYMAKQYENKADKTLLDDYLSKAGNLQGINNKATARTNLGLGDSSTKDVGTTVGTVAAGNDTRLDTVNGKSGGDVSTTIRVGSGGFCANVRNGGNNPGDAMWSGQIVSSIPGWGVPSSTPAGATGGYFSMNILTTNGSGGAYELLEANTSWFGIKRWQFDMNSGNAIAPGSWTNGSDERHKSDISLVENPLTAVLSWRGCTYERKDASREVGLIAQDVEKFCPEAVFDMGQRKFNDGTIIEDFKALNTAGVSAAYHNEAIKALFYLLELAIASPDDALEFIDDVKNGVNVKLF